MREDEDGSDAIKTDESDDEEEITLGAKAKLASKNKKLGVSAEVYGKHNPKKEFKPRVIEKTDEQKKKLDKRMNTNFLFSALDNKNKLILIDAMEEKRYIRGEEVIRQGDQGDEMFVVESGSLDCYRRTPDSAQEKFLKIYNPGDAFGELALLYNAPRYSLCLT